jgi:cell division protein FtsI (penicillin-binding protein 3)
MLKRMFSRQGKETSMAPQKGRVVLEGVGKSAIETGRTRLVLGGIVFLAAFLGIGLRLVNVTVIDPEHRPSPIAKSSTQGLKMERADILDRNGVMLATSLPTASLYASLKDLRSDPKEAAQAIAGVLPGLNPAELASRLASEKNFVYIKRNLTPQQQYAINRLGIPGLNFEYSERRLYPQGNLAAHVVGMADLDNKGIAGVEKTFDGVLRGSKEPIQLSIDVRVQHVMRQELADAIKRSDAIGGTGMVLDAKTGEMIAMVSLPDFDPNIQSSMTPEAQFNRATLGSYEMGSTFKLFTAAAVIDAGIASVNSTYDAREPIKVSHYLIRDYHPMNRSLTVEEIIIHSSNIGAAKMALDLGTPGQKEFMSRIGMLKPVALELPEVGSPLVPSPWRDINTMTIAFGHGLSVTPLHLAMGTSVLVNGGQMHQPTMLKRQPGEEIPAKRVLAPKTSDAMRKMMRAVVDQGTGGKAEAAGYFVGGKTGTAEKLGSHGGYARKALLSSFVGAFPIDDPRYVVLAMVDEPKGTKETFGYATGGWIAAPVVGRVVAQIGPLLGLTPRLDPAAAPQLKGQQAQIQAGVRKVAAN